MRMWLSALLCAALLLAGAAASAEPVRTEDALYGFTACEVYESAMLSSVIHVYDHEYSGAKLVYVENDDPEAAFAIGFHTPYLDETDANHVFEHSILAGSEKYPSKDIFFDMDNRAFLTHLNATTYNSATTYQIASTSQEQLLRCMDVVMSCMDAPLIMKDERIFKREALRYALDDPESDIEISGTVYAEDVGYLTDVEDNATDHVLDALYPGEFASNAIGQAHVNYADLTYEHVAETFDRFYHFDNCLIFLYGDLDIDRFLELLDAEYLSKSPAQGTDLSAWADDPTPAGFAEVEAQVPAYEGDQVESASQIDYAFDLDGVSDVELAQYDTLCTLLNMSGSPLYAARMERGAGYSIEASVSKETIKPYLTFTMVNAEPEQRAELKAIVDDALARTASEGMEPRLLDTVVRSAERGAKLMRDSTRVGVGLAEAFILNWAWSGEANVFRAREQALDALEADGEQATIRRLAGALLEPRSTALVASVPTPGLAEAYERDLDKYLADMKAGLSEEGIRAMVDETVAFNEWNDSEQANFDFLISPEDLPDPTLPAYAKREVDGVTVYAGDTSMEGAGAYALYFDLSGMSREEIEYLNMTSVCRLDMGTDAHTAEELSMLVGEYTSDLSCTVLYPGEAAGEYHRPMLKVSWSALTEDFDTALRLVLEIFTRTDYHDEDALRRIIPMYAGSWDVAWQPPEQIAGKTAFCLVGLRADSFRFELDVNGQSCGDLIADAAMRITTDEGFAGTLAGRFDEAVRKAFTRDGVIFMLAAPAAERDGLIETAVEALDALPDGESADQAYALPDLPAKSMGICVDAALNCTYMGGDFMDDPDFNGGYIPFVYALNDLYTVPTFRFKLGAYTAETSHQWGQGTIATYVASDPNVGATVDALRAMPEALEGMELTQEALDGYILKAYGRATAPLGALNEVMTFMEFDMMGMDIARTQAIKSEIRKSDLEMRDEAVAHLSRILEGAAICTAGNEALITADADRFDRVVSYRRDE